MRLLSEVLPRPEGARSGRSAGPLSHCAGSSGPEAAGPAVTETGSLDRLGKRPVVPTRGEVLSRVGSRRIRRGGPSRHPARGRPPGRRPGDTSSTPARPLCSGGRATGAGSRRVRLPVGQRETQSLGAPRPSRADAVPSRAPPAHSRSRLGGRRVLGRMSATDGTRATPGHAGKRPEPAVGVGVPDVGRVVGPLLRSVRGLGGQHHPPDGTRLTARDHARPTPLPQSF